MNLQLSKWGNSLAVRIPTTYIRHAGLKEGDVIHLGYTVDGALCLRRPDFQRKAFGAELDALRAQMPVTESVIEELRRGERF